MSMFLTVSTNLDR